MNVQCSLQLQYHDEVPLSKGKAPNPQLLPGAAALAAHCSGCVFTVICVCVCVHLGLNAEHKYRV